MSRQPSDDPTRTDDANITLDHARTAILRYLSRRDEPVENLELVTTAVRKAELDDREVSAIELPFCEVHDRVTTTHLPALAREGLVEYDRANGRVALAASPDERESLLQSPESER